MTHYELLHGIFLYILGIYIITVAYFFCYTCTLVATWWLYRGERDRIKKLVAQAVHDAANITKQHEPKGYL